MTAQGVYGMQTGQTSFREVDRSSLAVMLAKDRWPKSALITRQQVSWGHIELSSTLALGPA